MFNSSTSHDDLLKLKNNPGKKTFPVRKRYEIGLKNVRTSTHSNPTKLIKDAKQTLVRLFMQ